MNEQEQEKRPRKEQAKPSLDELLSWGKESEEPSQTEQKGQETHEEGPSLKEVIEETAREDEQPLSSQFTLRKILGGDILYTRTIRKQIWLILLIALFTIIYVANRYSCQKDLIEIDHLNTAFQKSKYKALSKSSELTEMSRESNVLETLKANKDSSLKQASQPPFLIEIP